MFTKNVTPGLVINIPRKFELALLAVTALALALWVFAPPGPVTLVACAMAAVLHTVRLWMWHPWVTFKRPILWILHAAYAWLPIGFCAGAGAGGLGELFAGGACVWRGRDRRAHHRHGHAHRAHTGRPLQVARPEVLAYTLVMLAAVLRAGACRGARTVHPGAGGGGEVCGLWPLRSIWWSIPPGSCAPGWMARTAEQPPMPCLFFFYPFSPFHFERSHHGFQFCVRNRRAHHRSAGTPPADLWPS